MKAPRHIWVVQTAFLGDCVLTLPLLQRLLESFPQASIEILATGAGAELFEIALERSALWKEDQRRLRVHRLDKRGTEKSFWGLRGFVRRLREQSPPDEIYCVQRSFRSGLLAFLSHAPRRIGFGSGAASFFYTTAVRRDWESGRSEIEKNLDLLRAAWPAHEIKPWDPRRAPSILSAKARPRSAEEQARLSPEGPIVLSLGSPWATKRWPVENAVGLVRELTQAGREVKILGDKASIGIGEELRRQVPSLLLTDLSGQTSLREWIHEIESAAALVSGDSAAVHVASDLGVPVLALFGPTLPEFGFAPWRPGSMALGVSDLPCRPCHVHGPARCPLGHHRCLKDISGDRVHRYLIRNLLQSRLGSS